MENKTTITRDNYVNLCMIPLILGIIINAICSTKILMIGLDYYSAFFMGFGMLLIGFGMGLSVAHSFKIIK
jgi:hypothetical protein